MPLTWTKSRPLSFARSVNHSRPAALLDDAPAAAGGGALRSPHPASRQQTQQNRGVTYQFTNLLTYQLTKSPIHFPTMCGTSLLFSSQMLSMRSVSGCRVQDSLTVHGFV